MSFKQWSVYNHALISNIAPNIVPNINELETSEIWKNDYPLFARWVTDWDCGKEADWWYVIKDEKFDISKLPSRYRYKINKGNRYFNVIVIDPKLYKEEIYNVQVAAYADYPEKYRPSVDKEKFINSIDEWDEFIVFGAFNRETGELSGYSRLTVYNEAFIELSVIKSNPEQEKFQLNASIVNAILEHFNDFFDNGGILSDGARNIVHETNFQEYLIKYFGFRKANCTLNIKYRRIIGLAVKILYPFRKILKKMDNLGVIHLVNGVMMMEEVVRSQKRRKS